MIEDMAPGLGSSVVGALDSFKKKSGKDDVDHTDAFILHSDHLDKAKKPYLSSFENAE